MIDQIIDRLEKYGPRYEARATDWLRTLGFIPFGWTTLEHDHFGPLVRQLLVQREGVRSTITYKVPLHVKRDYHYRSFTGRNRVRC